MACTSALSDRLARWFPLADPYDRLKSNDNGDGGRGRGAIVRKFGYAFRMTPAHMTPAQLTPLRFEGDPLADDALDALVRARADESAAAASGGGGPVARLPVDALEALRALRDRGEPDPAVARFWATVGAVPAWVDRAVLERGQRVFACHAAGAGVALLHLSLAGGFSAPLINHVLRSTRYLNAGEAGARARVCNPAAERAARRRARVKVNRRLSETLQMIVDCMHGGGAVYPPAGKGFESALRVRLLHARVRRRLRAMARWDEARWGCPINQEDMVATLLSFQVNIVHALEIAGVRLSREDKEAYTHLWRYVGFLSGVAEPHNPCTSYRRSARMLDSIVAHIIEPDAASGRLTRGVLRAVAFRPPFHWPVWTYRCHAALARLFMGDPLADRLGLPRPSLFHYVLHRFFHFSLIRLASWLGRLFARLGLGEWWRWFVLARIDRVARVHQRGGRRTKFAMRHAPSEAALALSAEGGCCGGGCPVGVAEDGAGGGCLG